jgi:hypothetical protein
LPEKSTLTFSNVGSKREAMALGASVAAVFLFCFTRLLFLGDVVYCLDAGRLHLPIKVFLAERLRSGELPLWYPYDGLGTPFIANAVTAVFHPFTLWSLAFSPEAALTWSLMSCVLIGQCGSYWLARRLGAGLAGAACAGIAFAASGTLLSSLNNLTFLCGACAFPAWLASLHVAAVGGRRWGFAAAGCVLAFTALAGDFQGCYFYALASLPLLIAFGSRFPRALAAVAVSSAVGFLLSSVQLVPTLSVVQELRRTQGFPYEEAVVWSLPWLRLPELVLGDVLRYRPFHLGAGPQLLQLMGYGGKAPWYPNVYLGILGALGATWAITLASGPRRRAAIGLLAVGAVFLWLALGRNAGLYALFYRVLPLWRAFRYPEKALNYSATLFAVLAGLGVSAALDRPSKAWRTGAGVGGTLLALAGLVALLPDPIAALALRIGGQGNAHFLELGQQYASQLGEVLLRAGTLAAIAGGLLLLATRTTLAISPLIPLLLAGTFLIDLGSVNSRAVAMCSGDRDSAAGRSLTAEALAALGEKRPGHFRVGSYAGYGMAYHPDVDALAGASYRGAAEWDRQTLAADFSALYQVESLSPYLPAVSDRYQELLHHDGGAGWRVYWSALFNGRFEVGDLRRLEQEHREEDVVAKLDSYNLYLARIPRSVPRAFIAVPRFASSREEARRAISEPDALSGRVAVFETAPQSGFESASGTAEVISYRPENVVIRTRLQSAGALVLSDAFLDGWVARVDGVEAPIHRANYLVRGLLLTAGEHQVVFSYPLPRAIAIGGLLSFATLVALIAALAWSFRSLAASSIPQPAAARAGESGEAT